MYVSCQYKTIHIHEQSTWPSLRGFPINSLLRVYFQQTWAFRILLTRSKEFYFGIYMALKRLNSAGNTYLRKRAQCDSSEHSHVVKLSFRLLAYLVKNKHGGRG